MKSWRYAGEKGYRWIRRSSTNGWKWPKRLPAESSGPKCSTTRLPKNSSLRRGFPQPERPPPAGYPCADIAETAQEILVLVDLPGVRKEDIQLSLNSGQLHLKGIVRTGLPGEALHLSERRRGEFERSYVLPRRIEGVCGPVKAALQEGLLIVRIPVADPPHTRIPIE
ncbi:Hsp20/alpha crystallin family protein [Paenibacillus sp. CC-CFT747]|nr:Hsp20/alpha crystallin family protein [Paenibacillus sp. CC-CFT747]